MFVSGNSYIGNTSSDLLLVTASSYFEQPVILNSNQISGSGGGNITLQSLGKVVIAGDLQIQGNNIIDSAGTTRITLGSSTTLDATTAYVNADVRLRSSDTLYFGTPTIAGSNHIQIKQNNNTSRAISLEASGSSNRWGYNVNTSNNLEFAYNGTAKGYFNSAATASNQVNFTGQHKVKPLNDNLLEYSSVGLIVVSTGEYDNTIAVDDPRNNISINEALPIVTLSNVRNQRSVFGVISDHEDPNQSSREYLLGLFVSVEEKKSPEDNRLVINSLGEGGIWVCNINGDLENGNYITTCEIPGLGMKQDSEFLANYTVAKITCDCIFDLNSQVYRCEEFVWNGQTYRKAFVGCTYHCG